MKALTHSLISSDFSIPGSASETALANRWSSMVSVAGIIDFLHQLGCYFASNGMSTPSQRVTAQCGDPELTASSLRTVCSNPCPSDNHAMFPEETALFACAGETLVSILAKPDVPAQTGVIVIVGGPQ